MGLQMSMTGGASLRRLSDGYFYIYLPPIFMCLLSVLLMYLSKKEDFTLHVSLTKNT